MRCHIALSWALLVLGASGSLAAAQEKSLRDRIDAHFAGEWAAQKIAPAGPSEDAAFLRRVYLDVIGVIPTYDEAREFLADPSPDRRARLVDRLLDDPRYSVQQAKIWELVLFTRKNLNTNMGDRTAVRQWLQTRFAQNAPYDQWVRELLVAEGNSQDHGPPLFYVQFRAQPEPTTVAVTRIFLGMQLQCAECHDHPYEKWTQRDFYGMAAFFARLSLVEGGSAGTRGTRYFLGEKRTGEVLFTGPAVDARPGQKGEPIGARFLDGKVLSEPPLPKDYKEPAPMGTKGAASLPKPDFSRKEQLASWLTGPDNPWFARAAVNRLWGQFLRRGIVHPVDNLNDGISAGQAALLDELAQEFKAHRFDLKWLIREVVNSRPYQLAAHGPSSEPVAFEQMTLRPLSAEEMVQSLRNATGYPVQEELPSNFERDVMTYFGEAVDGRGRYQGNLTERLFLNNAGTFRAIIHRRPGGLWAAVADLQVPVQDRVERLFMTVLTRPPTATERQRFADHIAKATAAAKDTIVEEAIWALLTSAEFRFNH